LGFVIRLQPHEQLDGEFRTAFSSQPKLRRSLSTALQLTSLLFATTSVSSARLPADGLCMENVSYWWLIRPRPAALTAIQRVSRGDSRWVRHVRGPTVLSDTRYSLRTIAGETSVVRSSQFVARPRFESIKKGNDGGARLQPRLVSILDTWPLPKCSSKHAEHAK
jgi:hypothetical protein